MSDARDLPQKMLDWAKGHPGSRWAPHLHVRARELRDALDSELDSGDWAERVLQAWIRARRVWSRATGEPIL